jgi:manganese efflux pump family protein
MPLIGLTLGSAFAHGIGVAADYLAAIIVSGIGAWLLLSADEDEEATASRVTTSRGLALIGLGIGISIDELAIGFGIGPTRLPVTTVIALQAFTAAQLGLTTGARIAERWREHIARLAGITLIVLGVCLIVGQHTR